MSNEYIFNRDAVGDMRDKFIARASELEDLRTYLNDFASRLESDVIDSNGGRLIASAIRDNLCAKVDTLQAKFEEISKELQQAIDADIDVNQRGKGRFS